MTDDPAGFERRTSGRLPLRHAVGLCALGGVVFSLVFFCNLELGFSPGLFLLGFLVGIVVIAISMVSFALFGRLAGWRAAVLLSVAGAAGGLVFGVLNWGRLSLVWCALVGAIVLLFAGFMDSGLSFKRFGRQ